MGAKLDFRNTVFSKFESPANGFNTGADRLHTKVRLSDNVRTKFGRMGLSLGIDHTARENSSNITRIELREGIKLKELTVDNKTISTLINEIHESTEGILNLSTRDLYWRLRSGINYTLDPRRRIQSANLSFDYIPIDTKFRAGFNYQHQFTDIGNRIAGHLSHDFGSFLGGLHADYANEEGATITLRAGTSLTPYGKDGGYRFKSDQSTAASNLKAFTFVDNDGDGEFGPDDEPLPGMRINIDSSMSRNESDEDGVLFEPEASPQGLVDITLNDSFLEHPFYKPLVPGYTTILRPGTMPYVEFPVILTGSIDGIVFYANSDKAVEGLDLELVNEAGEVIATTTTAFDGYYTFEFVPPGSYTIRANTTQKVYVPPVPVTVTSEDLFAYGIDLELWEQAEEVPAADHEKTGLRSSDGEVAQQRHASAADDRTKPAPSLFKGLRADVETRYTVISPAAGSGQIVTHLYAPLGLDINEEDLKALGEFVQNPYRTLLTPNKFLKEKEIKLKR